jgi:CHASE3 domain sensor protein
MKTLGSMMDALKDKIEAILQEHAQNQAADVQNAGGQFDARFKAMEQKLLDMEGKEAQSRKAIKHINTASIFGIILTVIGFGAVIYFLNVH